MPSDKTLYFSIQNAKKSWKVFFKCSKLFLKMIYFINHSSLFTKMLLNVWSKTSTFTPIKFFTLLSLQQPVRFMLKFSTNIKHLKNKKIKVWTESLSSNLILKLKELKISFLTLIILPKKLKLLFSSFVWLNSWDQNSFLMLKKQFH